MKNGFLKRVAAVVLAIIMSISGVVEPKAATGSTIKLFGIHDTNTMFQHTDYRCMWMKEGGSLYRKADPTATIKKKHYARANSVYASLKGSDFIIIKTHGSYNSITLYDKEGDGLTASHLYDSTIKNGPRLDRLKLCIVMACNSWNMARTIQEQGASAAIGFKDKIYSAQGACMLNQFNKSFTSKSQKTLSLAMYDAKLAVYRNYSDHGNLDKYEIYGHASLLF